MPIEVQHGPGLEVQRDVDKKIRNEKPATPHTATINERKTRTSRTMSLAVKNAMINPGPALTQEFSLTPPRKPTKGGSITVDSWNQPPTPSKLKKVSIDRLPQPTAAQLCSTLALVLIPTVAAPFGTDKSDTRPKISQGTSWRGKW